MTTAPILPFIHAQGSWGEIGRQVGQMFQPAIERHLEAWTRHIVAETGCARDALAAAAASTASREPPVSATTWRVHASRCRSMAGRNIWPTWCPISPHEPCAWMKGRIEAVVMKRSMSEARARCYHLGPWLTRRSA